MQPKNPIEINGHKYMVVPARNWMQPCKGCAFEGSTECAQGESYCTAYHQYFRYPIILKRYRI